MIDIDTLHDEIYANATAKALADSGDDAGAAAVIGPTLPKLVVSPTFVTERAVIAAFTNPADGEAVLTAVEAAAQSNPLVARALKWLQPANGGIDFGNPAARRMFDSFAASGVLTAAQVATLKGLAEVPPPVTYVDVSAAWARHRPDGRITGLSS